MATSMTSKQLSQRLKSMLQRPNIIQPQIVCQTGPENRQAYYIDPGLAYKILLLRLGHTGNDFSAFQVRVEHEVQPHPAAAIFSLDRGWFHDGLVDDYTQKWGTPEAPYIMLAWLKVTWEGPTITVPVCFDTQNGIWETGAMKEPSPLELLCGFIKPAVVRVGPHVRPAQWAVGGCWMGDDDEQDCPTALVGLAGEGILGWFPTPAKARNAVVLYPSLPAVTTFNYPTVSGYYSGDLLGSPGATTVLWSATSCLEFSETACLQ
ncbi:hypothetical protein K493DRAFT_311862 [Basidiobolus meristosporus CBS 931.73]|uniref:Uncharacterized protein n=1 Tax=Basidiobolus meristosporus CBS 931.73 TaxID=1314790 RepID=A0A1Y1YZ31_9FUNG|nr:hypothetical protein K493DRAFT_311862 [Basidiobolus meristosporus CBS 931.73]|eukprot:ORY03124.1 hypothetical protein K493DRAFT_311862 [Basidiobolus meristosporus CBS 931.73]